MTDTYTKLKELLKAQGTLSNDDIQKLVSEHGEMTQEEVTALEAEKLEMEKDKRDVVTMDQYLEALKVLDETEEGSDEYKKAEAIVDRYESGG